MGFGVLPSFGIPLAGCIVNRYVSAATTDSEASDAPHLAAASEAETAQEDRPRLAGIVRVLLGLGGSVLIGLLAIAAWLHPSPDGMGTHRQIRLPWSEASSGLPACGFLVQFERPCPSCGMTTSWAYLMDGNVWAAVQTNVAGFWLGLLALISGPWMLFSAVRGVWCWGHPSDGAILAIGIGTIVLTIGHWIFRLIAG